MAFKPTYISKGRLPQRLNAPYADFREDIRVGQQASNLGNVITQWAVIKQQQRDAAVVAEAYNDFYDVSREEISRLFQLEGKDAVGLGQQYNRFFDKASGEFMNKRFETSRQQTEFDNLVQTVRKNALDNLAQREAAEHQRYKVEVFNSHLITMESEVRQNPFNDDARNKSIETIFGYIDSEFSGHDNRLRKQQSESTLLAASMQEMININPGAAKIYLEKWGPGKLGDAYTKFKNKIDAQLSQNKTDFAYRKLFAKWGDNYESAIDEVNDPANWGADNLNLDAESAKNLHNRLIGLRNYRQSIEAERERELKERIKDNDMQAWIDFHDGKLSPDELKSLAQNRKISEETYNGIYNTRSGGAKEDNIFVVGDLVEDMKYGRDIKQGLIDAANRGQIKTETFLSLRKANADKKVQKALDKLETAMKPSPYDQYFEDKNLRLSDARDLLLNRIREESDEKDFNPSDIADEIIESYRGDLRSTIQSLPKPKFLFGKPNDFKDLSDAYQSTIEAFANGVISKSQFDFEIRNLKQYFDVLRRQAEIEKAGK